MNQNEPKIGNTTDNLQGIREQLFLSMSTFRQVLAIHLLTGEATFT